MAAIQLANIQGIDQPPSSHYQKDCISNPSQDGNRRLCVKEHDEIWIF